MSLYGGIDLHANNSVIVLLNQYFGHFLAKGVNKNGHELVECELTTHLTGCKFSREHTLLSLALVEVQNKGRVGCRQTNVWKARVAITTQGA